MKTYAEFFKFYLGEHARSETRYIHFAGTLVGTLVFLSGIFIGPRWLIPVGAVLGYGPAWVAHFFVERNRPATFKYPLWSFISDYRMLALWLTGGLDRYLTEAGIEPEKKR